MFAPRDLFKNEESSSGAYNGQTPEKAMPMRQSTMGGLNLYDQPLGGGNFSTSFNPNRPIQTGAEPQSSGAFGQSFQGAPGDMRPRSMSGQRPGSASL